LTLPLQNFSVVLFVIMQGALDGGLDIPHGEKRFAGFKKDEKQLDAEVHRKYIYGGHVAEYMRVKIAYALNITYTLMLDICIDYFVTNFFVLTSVTC
jgi:hypothetical protein